MGILARNQRALSAERPPTCRRPPAQVRRHTANRSQSALALRAKKPQGSLSSSTSPFSLAKSVSASAGRASAFFSCPAAQGAVAGTEGARPRAAGRSYVALALLFVVARRPALQHRRPLTCQALHPLGAILRFAVLLWPLAPTMPAAMHRRCRHHPAILPAATLRSTPLFPLWIVLYNRSSSN